MSGADDAVGTDEAARRIGCTRRQLDHWVRSGLVPGMQSPGSGHALRWPPDCVRFAADLHQLIGWGFSPAAAARHLNRGVDPRRLSGALHIPEEQEWSDISPGRTAPPATAAGSTPGCDPSSGQP